MDVPKQRAVQADSLFVRVINLINLINLNPAESAVLDPKVMDFLTPLCILVTYYGLWRQCHA